MSKNVILLTGLLVFTLAGCSPDTGKLTEEEARKIAIKECIDQEKREMLTSAGRYNENSQTWWFDVQLSEPKEGCNPACVVAAATKAAEINWRCTGLIAD